MKRMLLLPSRKTTWKRTVAVPSALQVKCRTSRHSITSSRFGVDPITAQKTFCAVPLTAKRSSQNGATRVPIAEAGAVVRDELA